MTEFDKTRLPNTSTFTCLNDHNCIYVEVCYQFALVLWSNEKVV